MGIFWVGGHYSAYHISRQEKSASRKEKKIFFFNVQREAGMKRTCFSVPGSDFPRLLPSALDSLRHHSSALSTVPEEPSLRPCPKPCIQSVADVDFTPMSLSPYGWYPGPLEPQEMETETMHCERRKEPNRPADWIDGLSITQ